MATYKNIKTVGLKPSIIQGLQEKLHKEIKNLLPHLCPIFPAKGTPFYKHGTIMRKK